MATYKIELDNGISRTIQNDGATEDESAVIGTCWTMLCQYNNSAKLGNVFYVTPEKHYQIAQVINTVNSVIND